MTITKVAIVGGGTAGWLAANHLGLQLQETEITVTVIESPDIPAIGVGEGTVPAIRQTLKKFGISETQFIRECDVTFKQSIKFINWLDKHQHGSGNFYHHLFENPQRFGEQLASQWLDANHSQQRAVNPFAQCVSPQFSAVEQNKAPKTITTPEYESVLAYAYHLNAAKFARLLADNAKSKFAVRHQLENVIDAHLHTNGAIKSLVLDKSGEQAFDFYIDCSGFESVLHDKVLRAEFVDKSSQLLVNQAIVAQVPTEPDSEIPPYTKATAHKAGWIWDIALTHRRGVGLVYSDNYMPKSTAEDKMAQYLGDNADISTRQIPMKVGYRKQFWYHNCVALGLAQGFLEPIEATSILLTDFASHYLASRFPKHGNQIPMLRDRFNKTMTYAWERVVEFAKMHYCLSDRNDSPFWIDNRLPETIPEPLRQRLEMWQHQPPITDDFFSRFEVFNLDNYQYVLYGMQFQNQMQKRHLQASQNAFDRVSQVALQLSLQLPEHRQLLQKINQFGLQKV
ncbi:tryptophan halogenase family protein [Shewanella maritima]|uniref:tryptophan halogenase family protein n=1 Tax=Shewanella maritima TaxID=2520507 RepID=UPI003735B15C